MNETHRHASPQHRQACAIKHVILMMDAWHRFGEERKRGASKVSDEANWITHNELHQNFSSANFHLAPLVNLSEKNHAIVGGLFCSQTEHSRFPTKGRAVWAVAGQAIGATKGIRNDLCREVDKVALLCRSESIGEGE